MLVLVPSTVNVLQRVELLSLKLIKQGYVVPKVKYLKCCILYQRKLPFVITGSLGRGEELVSLGISVNMHQITREISLKITSYFHALLTHLKRRDRYT